jgi:7-cyano-7-deazaguanine synthase in queuosine biosynthesis
VIAVLFSGGIDSLIHLWWAEEKFGARQLRLIYFDAGQCYAKRELSYAERLAVLHGLKLDVIPLTALKEDKKTGHIPMRNLLFLLHVAASTEPEYDGVVFGMLKAESSEDKNPAFIRRTQKLIDTQFAKTMYRAEKREFIIYTPFAGYTKTQMIRWYLQRDFPAYQLYETVACYTPQGEMCGECISCANRWLAFDQIGLTPEKYLEHPADGMLHRLWLMAHNKSDSNWKAVGLIKAWKRRQWIWEMYRSLTRYCKAKYGVSVWRYAHR